MSDAGFRELVTSCMLLNQLIIHHPPPHVLFLELHPKVFKTTSGHALHNFLIDMYYIFRLAYKHISWHVIKCIVSD